MTGEDEPGRPGGAGRDARERRLAERLRENLRRRKAQARARGGRETPGQATEAAEGDED